MLLLELLPGLLVAFSFYTFYRNLFPEHPGLLLISIAFFFSLSSVGFAIFLELGLGFFLDTESSWVEAFLLSSLPEEFAKFTFIFLYFKIQKINHTLSEGIFYGIVFGLFFGLVENGFYSLNLGIWPMLVRSTTALPLHMLTGGILGAFILTYQNSNQRNNPSWELFQGFLICFLLHGFYNYSVFTSGDNLYWLPIVLIAGFGLMEYEIMKSQNTLSREIMQLIGLKWDDYEIVQRFKQYLSWMDVDQEKFHRRNIPIIRTPRLKLILFTLVLIVLGIGFGIYLQIFPEMITKTFEGIQFPEYVSIFVFYPIFTGISLSFSGSLNPEYFRFMVLRIPVFISLHIRCGDYEETTVVFFLSRKGFYIPLLNPDQVNGKIEMEFWIAGRLIDGVEGFVYWKDLPDGEREGGALIQFTKVPWRLVFFWKYVLYRQRMKNILHIS